MEFYAVHLDVRKALVDLDAWSVKKGIPEVTITHCLRTREKQQEIYFKHVEGLRKKKLAKATLTAEENRIAGMSDRDAKIWSRGKFSWHLVGCGVDIRNFNYTKLQLLEVIGHLKTGRNPTIWEILSHDVSNGSHIHVGIRDFAWRKKYTDAPPTPVDPKDLKQ